MNELNVFLFATNNFIILLCGALWPIMPLLTRKSFLFGVKVPPEAQNTSEAKTLKRSYVMLSVISGLFVLAVSIGQYIVAPTYTFYATLFLPFILMGAQLVVFTTKHSKALELKSRLGWHVAEIKYVDTKTSFTRGNLSAMPHFWHVLSLIVIFVSFVIALLRYPALPDPIPTHWDISMKPDAWAPKSIGAALLIQIANVGMVALMWVAGVLVEKAKLQIDHEEPAKSFAQHKKYRQLMGHGIGLLSVAIAVMFFLLGMQSAFSGFVVPIWLLLAVAIVPVVSLVAVSVRAGQGGALLNVSAMEIAAGNGVISGNDAMSDDKYWIGGLFYYNPDDPACFVGNRFGMNLGFNYARLPVKIGVTIGVVVLVVMYAWIIVQAPIAINLPEDAKSVERSGEDSDRENVHLEENSIVGDGSTKNEAALATVEASARELVIHMASGDYAAVVAQFDQIMTKALSAERLEEAWETTASQAGAYAGIVAVESFVQEEHYICLITTRHESRGIVSRVAYDRDMRIAGLFFSYTENESSPEEYETAITIGADYPLEGVLALPGGEEMVPAVVLVHGSGPNDKDENVFGIMVFEDISDYLVANGVAVLRYDKRTYTHGAKLSPDITVREETIEDAILAGKILTENGRVDRAKLYVVGHSLGGMLTPRIIDESGGVFAGGVIMAGSPRSLSDIIYDQNMYYIALAEPAQRDALMKQVEDAKPYFGVPRGYIDDMDAHPVKDYLGETEKPYLILQGGKDFQVLPDKDFEAYKQIAGDRSNFEFHLYDDLTHLFTVSTMDTPTTDDYIAGAHVDRAPLEDIVKWIKAN